MNDDSIMFCTFEASGRLFGIPLIDIKEITAEINCTHIPHAPECVRGYANIRGQIILGLDLKKLLKLPSSDSEEAKRLVIFKQIVGPAFGLLVDEIGEIQSLSRGRLDDCSFSQTGLSDKGPTNLIAGVCRLPHQLLVVLDPYKFLPLIENELSKKST